MLKARSWMFALPVVLAACGGPEEDLALEEDALSAGGTLALPCTPSDDVADDWTCATSFWGAKGTFFIAPGDTDWFYLRSGSVSERYHVWAGNGTATTKCWVYSKQASGLVFEQFTSFCNWEQVLQPNTYYYMKVQTASTLSFGTYQLGLVIYHEAPDNGPLPDSCPECGVLSP